MSASNGTAPVAKDVTDAFRIVGRDAFVQAVKDNEQEWNPSPLPASPCPVPGSPIVQGNFGGLSIRSLDELMAEPPNDDDIILGDRILAKGQSLVIAGAGGLGKSALVNQGVCALASGLPWLSFANVADPLKVLILQSENSKRRLFQDFQRIRGSMGQSSWDLVRQNIRVQCPETENDHFLNLDVLANRNRIGDSIQSFDPDVVVIDPLNAFAAGDLNTDSEMRETCQQLSALSKAGNPDRALIVVHHALTGKAGASRAVGYDRSSHGRNSKTLYAWTRAQINIAPGSPDSNELLVVSCGKNNNGVEFPPFGIRRNPCTLLFELNPEFDLEAWRQEVTGSKTSGPQVTTAEVVGLLCAQPMSRAQLAKALMDETGCGKTKAYDVVKKAVERNLIAKDPVTKTYAAAH